MVEEGERAWESLGSEAKPSLFLGKLCWKVSREGRLLEGP